MDPTGNQITNMMITTMLTIVPTLFTHYDGQLNKSVKIIKVEERLVVLTPMILVLCIVMKPCTMSSPRSVR